MSVLDLRTLPYVKLEDKRELPTVPALYLAVDAADTVLYVGCTSNLRQRWAGHHKYEVIASYDGVRILWVRPDNKKTIPDLEREYIAHFSPPLNGDKGQRTHMEVSTKIWATVPDDLLEQALQYNQSQALGKNMTPLVRVALAEFFAYRKKN